ncbi:hypothetical protein [uncultured Thiothrix sp.]|uniref:hypothetical protein n=1 Tax=uncultured Thiothrix sp. TaxID=223185 RepID=UPI0026355C8B|nr:hypothetical protein [uncultured Thiothrix sp.]
MHTPNPSKSASYARTFSALPLGIGTPDLLAAGLVVVVCPGGGASPVCVNDRLRTNRGFPNLPRSLLFPCAGRVIPLPAWHH